MSKSPDWLRITALEAASRLWAGTFDKVTTEQVTNTADTLLAWMRGVAKDDSEQDEPPARRRAPLAVSKVRDATFIGKDEENSHWAFYINGNEAARFVTRSHRPVKLQCTKFDDAYQVHAFVESNPTSPYDRITVGNQVWHVSAAHGLPQQFDWDQEVEPGRFKLPARPVENEPLRPALTFWAYDNPRDPAHGATIFARRLIRDEAAEGGVSARRVAVWVNASVGWTDASGTMGLLNFDHEAARDEPAFRQVTVKQLHALGISLPPSDHDLFTRNS